MVESQKISRPSGGRQSKAELILESCAMYTLSEPDLDASIDLLAFMWIQLGNDPSSVRPQERLLVRVAISQNFPQLPPEIQMLFAHGRINYVTQKAEWEEADAAARSRLQDQYRTVLTLLGLIGSGSTPPLGSGSVAPMAGDGNSPGESSTAV